jgi:hypothetical protein
MVKKRPRFELRGSLTDPGDSERGQDANLSDGAAQLAVAAHDQPVGRSGVGKINDSTYKRKNTHNARTLVAVTSVQTAMKIVRTSTQTSI